MKSFAFILKLYTILRPLLQEVIKAIKAVQILKRAMRQEWDAVRLQHEITDFFKKQVQADAAIGAFLVAIHAMDRDFYDKEKDKPSIVTMINYLKFISGMPKPQRRMRIRELAKTLILKRNMDWKVEDVELETAIQVAYWGVEREERKAA